MKIKSMLKVLSKLALVTLAYDANYRFKYPLKKSYDGEKSLNLGSHIQLPDLNWINEQNYEAEMLHQAVPYIEKYKHSGKIINDYGGLSYDMYLINSDLPTIFIVHGFNEYKEKYQELIYYFLQLNYNVFVYDARGHGNSRIDYQKTLIDIKNFEDYVSDFKDVVDGVLAKFELKSPLYLFGHSMGGAVSASFLKNYPDIFNKAILSSPMMGVDTAPYPRSIAYVYASSARALRFGEQPIPAQGSNKGIEASVKEETYQPNYELTHSDSRGAYFYKVRKENVKNPTSSGTLNWLKASMKQVNQYVNEEYLSSIETPILIFRSIEDKVVRHDGIFTGATNLPNATLISVASSGHEIYQEHDDVVRPYVSLIAEFLHL